MGKGIWFVALVVAFVAGTVLSSLTGLPDADAKKKRRPPCPAGTQLYARVCIEKTPETSATFTDASQTCVDQNRRLPTGAELDGFRRLNAVTLATGGEWTADFVSVGDAVLTIAENDQGDGLYDNSTVGGDATFAFRCVG